MDWDEIAAGARGEGAAYHKQRKARMKKEQAEEDKRLAKDKWKVTITVHDATIYHSTDADGLSDPYMECYVGDSDTWKRIGVTKVQSDTLNPVWNETFEGTVNGLATEVKLKLYDKDKFGSDFIGTWKAASRSTGGKELHLNPKGDRRTINAKANVSISWKRIEQK